jgi:hypothetical protein
MFKASVQEARLMWGGTLGQRFWRLLVIRMAQAGCGGGAVRAMS